MVDQHFQNMLARLLALVGVRRPHLPVQLGQQLELLRGPCFATHDAMPSFSLWSQAATIAASSFFMASRSPS